MRIRTLQSNEKYEIESLIIKTGVFKPNEIQVALEVLDRSLKGDLSYQIEVMENDDGQILGFICFGLNPMCDAVFELYWIAVDPENQGKGIGHSLLYNLEKKVMELNGRMIVIETSSRPEYKNAREFYEDLGYEIICKFPNFYAPGDDKIVYAKVLNQKVLN